MACRIIGQEILVPEVGSRGGATLDRLSSLIDWRPVCTLLAPLYPSARGEPAWPPLSMFKALLLAVWYDLSDVKLAEALEDRASFRRFCGFAAREATPERTAFVRFRRALIAQGLDRKLFDLVTAQLKARAITVNTGGMSCRPDHAQGWRGGCAQKQRYTSGRAASSGVEVSGRWYKTGTLVDATIIPSASKGDGEARWVKHRNRSPVHGFKAHVGADADTALVEQLSVTPANVHDGREGPAALPEQPGDVFADSAYGGQHFAAAVLARGGVPRVAVTGMWGRDEAETLARIEAWNGPIQRVRARIEKIFGTWKRCTGLRRMRWRGLARATAQLLFTATAYNLKRSLQLQPA